MLCLGHHLPRMGLELPVHQIAVTNLPPALFSGIRFVTAGMLLALHRPGLVRQPVPETSIEWRHVIIAGFFMVFVSNGLNTWAMHYIAVQSVGAAQRHVGLLDRGPRCLRAARPPADALGGSRPLHRISRAPR